MRQVNENIRFVELMSRIIDVLNFWLFEFIDYSNATLKVKVFDFVVLNFQRTCFSSQ